MSTAKHPTGQRDDNIDDMGRRPDGTKQDQPGAKFEDDAVEAERDEKDNPNPSPMNPAFP